LLLAGGGLESAGRRRRKFGADIDYAQLTKLFGDYGQFGNDGTPPSPIAEVISKVRQDNPDPEHISTSYVERRNLTMRMQLRRLTRLTNAIGKKLDNLKAAVALHFAWYNFSRAHRTLRVTPAMESGIADHGWGSPSCCMAEVWRTKNKPNYQRFP